MGEIRSINERLVDVETGEFIGDVSPKFKGWTRDKYEESGIKFITPMTAQELELDKREKYIEEHLTIAEQKFDGHRCTLHLLKGSNRAFSRNVSKQTGWLNENTDQVPQLRDLYKPDNYIGTILDGELLVPELNCSCRNVQSITGALPETAIENQLKDGFAYLQAFDIIHHKGDNIHRMPLWRRKLYLLEIVVGLDSPYIQYSPMYMTKEVWEKYKALIPNHLKYLEPTLKSYISIIEENYSCICKDFIQEGKEGLMIKDLNGRYEFKRSKNYIKMKGHKTYDCVIMGFEDPVAAVDLKERKTKEEDWLYWESCEHDISITGKPKFFSRDECCPVTRFYAMGWIGAIHIGVYKTFYKDKLTSEDENVIAEASKLGDFAVIEDNHTISTLIQVGRCSGLNDETREKISLNKMDYLGKVVEVEAQHIINSDTGSLQHPRFMQFRVDKNKEDCTFNDHIRKYDEEEVHR